LQHNAQAYVSRLEQRMPVARQIRGIFNAPDVHEAQRLLDIASGLDEHAANMHAVAAMMTTRDSDLCSVLGCIYWNTFLVLVD
jgi:hypothetical protein